METAKKMLPSKFKKTFHKQNFILWVTHLVVPRTCLPPPLYKIAGLGDVLVTIFTSIIISFNFNCPTKHTHVDNKCLGVRAIGTVPSSRKDVNNSDQTPVLQAL